MNTTSELRETCELSMVLQYVGVCFQWLVHAVQQQPEGMLATAEWHANVQMAVVSGNDYI